ncbi:LAMI_0D09010g1_1 [Lachancea mirantina]|uniref:LAMI_0D09010g1_1 n=1 Tax=Lachancea mirantina TaxID=1230905 RepID=A0A1G4JDJ1_9SACH|nr:LAMI_0D09010g1_1 [Lachancea mirantina]
MSQRKLQQEIDKLLKKVKEGLQDFEDVYEKFQNTDASNSSYREKLEGDLKREIKKLQKHREQIKAWLSKEDVKDKQQVLMENRRLIESGMERFKLVEKLMKTKQFSTEALTNPDIIKDPRELKKRDQVVFIQECLEEVQKQLESFESQGEEIQIERHAFHIANLEHILKLLQNNELEPDSVEEFQDDIKYYVENNDDPDFIEYENIYEDMGCEIKAGEAEKEVGTPSKAGKASRSERSPRKKQSPAPSSAQDQAERDTDTPEPPAASIPGALSEKNKSSVSLTSPTRLNSTIAFKNHKKETTPQPMVHTPSAVQPPRDLSREIEEKITRDLNENPVFKNPLFSPGLAYWAQTKRPLLQPFEKMPPDMVSQLESSLLNCPDSLDADTPKLYQAPLSLPHPTSIFFPNEPIRLVSTETPEESRPARDFYSRTSLARIMSKFDLDTLFMVFYHYQGTYEQFLAAKELSNRGWQFNKINRCWLFKEVEKLPPGNEKSEEVSWRYFDYQKSWLARRCGDEFVYRQEDFEKI